MKYIFCGTSSSRVVKCIDHKSDITFNENKATFGKCINWNIWPSTIKSATLLAVIHERNLALIAALCACTSQTSFLEYSQEFNLIDHIHILGIELELA